MCFDNPIAGHLHCVSRIGPVLASTRIVLSVSNSPIDIIRSLKKKRKAKPRKVPLSAAFNSTLSTTNEFSLPFGPVVKTTKKRKGETITSNQTKKTRESDDVFD